MPSGRDRSHGELGWAVAISGSAAVAGAPNADNFVGAAYAYVRTGGKWSRQLLPDPDRASGNADFFGSGVGIAGKTIIVGAPEAARGGKAFVFTLSGRKWHKTAAIADPDPATGSVFGWAVAISGSTAVIGDLGANKDHGVVYVYAGDGATWRLEATLHAPHSRPGEVFGGEVAISRTTVLVGGGYESAYVFSRSGSRWKYQASLGSVSSAKNYTAAVAVVPGMAIVGRASFDGTRGATFVFGRTAATWHRTAMFADPQPVRGSYFGLAVAISATRLIVGASNPRRSSCGTGYEYIKSGNRWRERARIANPGCVEGDGFGTSVAVSGHTVLIGAPFRNKDAGAVYVLTVP